MFPDLRGGYRGESFEYVEKLIEFSDHCFAKVGNARVGKEFLVCGGILRTLVCFEWCGVYGEKGRLQNVVRLGVVMVEINELFIGMWF